MAVTRIRQLHQKRRSSYRDGKLSHTLVFQVKCDTNTDGPAVALTAKIMDGGTVVAEVPKAGDPFPGSTTIKLLSKDAQPVDDSDVLFEVTCEYGIPSSASEAWVEPLSRPVEINFSGTESTEDYFTDKSTTPKHVVNAAGEPFDQFLVRDSGELVVTLTRNEATFNAATADTYSQTTNAAIVTIDGSSFAIGTLKMSPISAVKTVETKPDGSSVSFYRITYTMKARRQGWDDKIDNVGYSELVGDELKQIMDDSDPPQAVRKPYPLTAGGAKAATPTTAPTTITFKPYESKSWAALSLS